MPKLFGWSVGLAAKLMCMVAAKASPGSAVPAQEECGVQRAAFPPAEITKMKASAGSSEDI